MKVFRGITAAAVMCLLSVSFLLTGITAKAYVTIGAEIPVSCLEVSDDGSTHTYEIKIKSENDASPAPNSDTLIITENGTGYFEINITEPGTFSYTVYELAGDDPDIGYDSNVYHVTVFVENGEEGELIYNVIASVEGRDTKPDRIDFRNVVLSDDDSREDSETDSSEAESSSSESTSDSSSTPAGTTAVTTTSGRKTGGDNTNPITGVLGSVLTGNSLAAHAVRLALIVLLFMAVSAFLLKQRDREEDEQNED